MFRTLAIAVVGITLAGCMPNTGLPSLGFLFGQGERALVGDVLVNYVEGYTLILRYEDATGTLFAQDGRFEFFNSRVSPQDGSYRYTNDSICLSLSSGESCRSIITNDDVRTLEGENARTAVIAGREQGNEVDLAVRAAAFPEAYPDEPALVVVQSESNRLLSGSDPEPQISLPSPTVPTETAPNLECSAVREQCVAACDANGEGISCKAACFAAHDRCAGS